MEFQNHPAPSREASQKRPSRRKSALTMSPYNRRTPARRIVVTKAPLRVLFMLGILVTANPALAKDEKPQPPRIGQPAAKPRAPGAIRLASYNLENLFDTKDDPVLTGPNDDLDDAKPEAQKRALAATIRAVNADVLALQEVESLEALAEFRDQCLEGQGYNYIESIDAGDERGIEQAVLSRFPVKDVKNWLAFELEGEHTEKDGNRPNPWFGKTFTFHRSPLRVTVEVPADKAAGKPYDLTLFVVHHKSARNFNYWREAEARGVLRLVEEFTKDAPNANIAVLGDFNAETQDDSLQIYLAAGFHDLFIDRPLVETACFTHASDRAIDLILFNSNLAPEIITTSRFVLGTPQLKPEEDWRTAPKPAGYASDHCPIVVDIKPVDQ
jgi:endonuclease/exonuclease/phosphatase family metal-dependent hydrolase